MCVCVCVCVCVTDRVGHRKLHHVKQENISYLKGIKYLIICNYYVYKRE